MYPYGFGDSMQKEIQQYRASELERAELGLWWLSFADADGFAGVVILEAYGFGDALYRSHKMGLNPGGEVQGFKVPYEDHPEALRNRLLKKTDLAGFGVITRTGDL